VTHQAQYISETYRRKVVRRISALELPYSRVGAFCALGNPESFWRTLDSLGIRPADRVTFGDHHAYRPREMRRLAHQFQLAKAEAALTTEKDALNLCEGCVALMAPLPVYWLKIRIEIDREEIFLSAIQRPSLSHSALPRSTSLGTS